MPHEKRNLKVVFTLRRPIAQTSPVFSPLSEGEALAVVVQDLPENPHGTRVFRVLDNKGKRGCAPRVSLLSGRVRAAREGGEVEGATPFLPLLMGHRAGMTIAHQIAHFSSPSGGSLPPQ